MLDRFSRPIEYLRVSVTDRCNHRCIYCMPETGVPLTSREGILSYEQIQAVVREAVALGIAKVRLTGGEPLIRRNIEGLVLMLAAIPGLRELCMTTNGTRLAAVARQLKANGLDRLNISIDSLDPEKYSRITRGGNLRDALDGVDDAIKAGFNPVKINMVISADTSESEVDAMRSFCREKGLFLQTILQFSLYDRNDLPARLTADRPPVCSTCNRLRLTSDGFLKPCLFSEHEIKVDFNNIRQSILDAVAEKPESGSACRNRPMHAIGG